MDSLVKKLVVAFLSFVLVCMTGGMIVIGVFGATFAGTCIGSGSIQLYGDDNQAKIYNYWLANDFTPAQAAGITASIKHESGYSPFRQEESASWPRGGYGIAQFTFGQRTAVTAFMSEQLGAEFNMYYLDQYGGGVSAENGYIPTGISVEINDKFLSAQLAYLSQYIASFKPSSIPDRTNGLQALTGLTVPRDATLETFMKSLGSAGDAAKAWTFLYEYPGNINSTANARGRTAEALFTELANQETDGGLKGSCGGNVVSPVQSDDLVVTSGSDIRTRSNGVTRMHEGIDLIGGKDIVAAMAGDVVVAQNGYFGYGTAVKIDHGDGTFTLYGHLVSSSYVVKVGDHVTAGQYLGEMGNTGDSEGVHLHFQVWIDNKLVNAFPFLVEHGVKLRWQDGAYPRNETPGPLYERDR